MMTTGIGAEAGAGGADTFAAMRRAMVASQLRPNSVSDARVVAAMDAVAREAFVPADRRAIAYRDTAVPLARGRQLNLPIATGRLLTEAWLKPEDTALLIGAASGYGAAVLALLVASVTAVESDPQLAATARAALSAHRHVTVIEGALADGHAAGAPYDVMVIDGAVEQVPDALVAQVRPGGRIVTGLIDRGVTRLAAGRKSAGGFGLVDFADLDCAVLPGFARPKTFAF